MSDHASEALRLMNSAKGLRTASYQPDAAGSAIRAGWAKQADELMAEALVHAALAAIPTPVPPKGQAD